MLKIHQAPKLLTFSTSPAPPQHLHDQEYGWASLLQVLPVGNKVEGGSDLHRARVRDGKLGSCWAA